jgi:enoyl-CoA hydratase
MVRYEEHDGCAVITLDRPEARNALTPEMARSIEEHLDRAEADDALRAVILTGAPPVFCAGTDLGLVGDGRHEGVWTERGGYGAIASRERTKPLIAALDGPSYGGGTEIALACDLIVAARGTGLALSEAKRGLVPAGGGLFRLAQKLPVNLAMQAGVTGDPVSAEVAHAHGLVNVLCEPGGALAAARELVAGIATCSPLAVRESRTVVLDAARAEPAEAWRLNDLAVKRTVDTEDAREGVAAFFEKRPPVWTGH